VCASSLNTATSSCHYIYAQTGAQAAVFVLLVAAAAARRMARSAGVFGLPVKT
jgi:hypothetical protein